MSIKDIILYIFCGIFCFSPISALVFNSVGIASTLNEIFLFLFFPFLLSRLKLRLNLIILFYGTIGILLLIIISLFVGDFPAYSILSTARGYFLLLLGFAYSVNSPFKIEDLKYVFFGSVIGWVYRAIDLINEVRVGNDESLVANGNLLALFGVVLLLLSRSYGKLISIITIFSVLYISIFSGSRRSVLVVGLALLFYFILNIKKVRSWSILIFVISGVLISMQYLIEILDDINPVMRFRLIDKFANLASNDSDQIRVGFVDRWVASLYSEFFPSGFISKRTFEDFGAGDYMDFPISELTKTFGLVMLFPFFFFFFYKLSIQFKKYINGNSEGAINLSFGILLIILIFVEGSFLNFVFITPMTGIILAKILNVNNITIDEHF
jgi:hypothetical protein